MCACNTCTPISVYHKSAGLSIHAGEDSHTLYVARYLHLLLLKWQWYIQRFSLSYLSKHTIDKWLAATYSDFLGRPTSREVFNVDWCPFTGPQNVCHRLGAGLDGRTSEWKFRRSLPYFAEWQKCEIMPHCLTPFAFEPPSFRKKAILKYFWTYK